MIIILYSKCKCNDLTKFNKHEFNKLIDLHIKFPALCLNCVSRKYIDACRYNNF